MLSLYSLIGLLNIHLQLKIVLPVLQVHTDWPWIVSVCARKEVSRKRSACLQQY